MPVRFDGEGDGSITVAPIAPADRAAAIPALAALRVAVFRAWPYLYDGDAAYEADYLRIYVDSPGAALILARQGERVVGASTCLPLIDETDNLQAPFRAHGWDPSDFFYFGESVLLPQCRGQGVGRRFFVEREAHARASTCQFTCFCSVVRPDDHPARPSSYVPLDDFWTSLGYTRRPDVQCLMSWKDVGASEETEKPLVFWMKSLTGGTLP